MHLIKQFLWKLCLSSSERGVSGPQQPTGMSNASRLGMGL